jgi:hypothetical protein
VLRWRRARTAYSLHRGRIRSVAGKTDVC